MTANKAEPIKIHGLGDVVTSAFACIEVFISSRGISDLPTKKPASKPIGTPIKERNNACLRIILLICLLVVPMVFRRP
ncbi:hypothetical protein D3C78_1918440 [compost metagenome]